MIWYTSTIFLSAFLLFAAQPVMAKYILPWFGGGAGIWTACMLFFQGVLLLGYVYAHVLSKRFSVGRQTLLHIAGLVLSVLILPITPDASSKPVGDEPPIQQILYLLTINIGIPFALLSSTGPLLSHWFSRSFSEKSPWRLYALSNAGSLLALLSYPFFIEPFLAVTTQATLWSWGYGVFVIGCIGCAWNYRYRQHNDQVLAGSDPVAVRLTSPPSATASHTNPPNAPSNTDRILWLALATTASVMLLTTTRQISQDLAVVPLLWIAPLALYLLSYILCFDHSKWYQRLVYAPLLVLGAAAVIYVMSNESALNAWIQIPIYIVTFFVACMICHGELVRLRPSADALTHFYLIVGAGGALGGLLVGVAAPHVFSDFWEYHLGLFATCLLLVFCVLRSNHWQQLVPLASEESGSQEKAQQHNKHNKHKSKGHRRLSSHGGGIAIFPLKNASAWGISLLLLAIIGGGLGWNIHEKKKRVVESSRSFYGVLHILELRDSLRLMEHGRTIHGAQYIDRLRRRNPTTYYEQESGLGIALAEYRRLQKSDITSHADSLLAWGTAAKGLRIGTIGLGTGTIAALAQSGDSLRFYEIDPHVERLARQHFSYLDDSAATVEVILGDARITLEREIRDDKYQNFDVLVVDAFASDAVPIHLLTHEAMALYAAHLKPHGMVIFHVTNRYLTLDAVVRGLADYSDFNAVQMYTAGAGHWSLDSDWIIVTRNPALLASEEVNIAATPWSESESLPILWSDEYASLWSAIAITKGQPRGKWTSAPNKGHFAIDNAGLIKTSDLQKIHSLGRRIYHESDGKTAIVVSTILARPTIAGKTVSPAAFLEKSYYQFGLDERGEVAGILLLLSVADDLTFIRVPKDWPAHLRKQVVQVVSTMMADGIAVSDISSRVLSGVKAIAALVQRPK
jgi:hypothetical protein